MDTSEMLERSHLTVFQTIDDLPEVEWDIPGACGKWAVKDIIAHLTSYEHVMVDTLNTFLGSAPSANVLKFIKDRAAFNNAEVEARQYHTAQQVEDEYNDTQLQSSGLLAQIPKEIVQQIGTMPWYGSEHSLANFVKMVYEHTREHCDQIVAFRKRIK